MSAISPPPKLRGKSPGRGKGDRPSPLPRYPTVKKRASKRKKSAEKPSGSFVKSAEIKSFIQ